MNVGVTGSFVCTIPGENPSHIYELNQTVNQPSSTSIEQSTNDASVKPVSQESAALTALVDLLAQAKQENNTFLTAIIAHEKQPAKKQKQ